MRRTRLALALVVVLCPFAASAAQAKAPGTLSGSVTGLKAPPPGKGEAALRAMSLNSGVLRRAAPIKRSGAFRLRAPAGAYALFGYEVRPPPNSKVVDKLVGSGVLKAGRTTKVALSTRGLKKKKKKRKRKRRRPAAHGSQTSGIGDVSVSHPAIWVQRFTVAGGGEAWSEMGRGTMELLINDLLHGLEDRPRCKAQIVEREKIGQVMDELNRSQSKFFDPKTRLQKGKIVKDNSTVTGTVAVTGAGAAQRVTITSTYRNFNTGQTSTVTKSGPASQFFELEQQVVAGLLKKICNPPKPPPALPPAYSGTFSARLTNSGVPGYLVEFTSGTARFVSQGDNTGSYHGYGVASGSATVTVHAPGSEGCEVDGSGPVSWAPGGFALGQLNIYAGSPRTYDVKLATDPYASIQVITSGCTDPADDGKVEAYSVGSQSGLLVPRPGDTRSAVQASGAIAGTTTYNSQGVLTHTFTWALNPSQ
ncbi:MAG TPA: hypothetical protein VH683_03070 [Thermoleophilaceae bacterium]